MYGMRSFICRNIRECFVQSSQMLNRLIDQRMKEPLEEQERRLQLLPPRAGERASPMEVS